MIFQSLGVGEVSPPEPTSCGSPLSAGDSPATPPFNSCGRLAGTSNRSAPRHRTQPARRQCSSRSPLHSLAVAGSETWKTTIPTRDRDRVLSIRSAPPHRVGPDTAATLVPRSCCRGRPHHAPGRMTVTLRTGAGPPPYPRIAAAIRHKPAMRETLMPSPGRHSRRGTLFRCPCDPPPLPHSPPLVCTLARGGGHRPAPAKGKFSPLRCVRSDPRRPPFRDRSI